MKTDIGGDRLGSGNKQEISKKNYERSTHDLSETFRSSMSSGTLVPFLHKLALSGDSWDIDLHTSVLTLPTVGPLFGSYKVQLDVFATPLRLYNPLLMMNKLNIGRDMSKVYLPQMKIKALNRTADADALDDNRQVNPSCLLKYLGVSGIGKINSQETVITRNFNASNMLIYWDIYKNYYANKQEERGFCIHVDSITLLERQAVQGAELYKNGIIQGNILDNDVDLITTNGDTLFLIIRFGLKANQMEPEDILIGIDGVQTDASTLFSGHTWDNKEKTLTLTLNDAGIRPTETWNMNNQFPTPITLPTELEPSLREFPLENIDKMKEACLGHRPTDTPFVINENADLAPYNFLDTNVVVNNINRFSIEYGQELLGIKTYQSDLFNNWISTEWIDGTNGINEVTSISTVGDSFTIDAFNIASKVYLMLNRIAISGGTFDDWLSAVYGHERKRGIASPMYLGSLIKELGFEEVISNSETGVRGGESSQPLGTLAGRGQLTQKNKGGKINYKCDEPSVIMGLVSLTPRIDYSQGNDWTVNLETYDDFHKPPLDGIGFQELITEQMAWQSTEISQTGGVSSLVKRSAGKQPAWINYMTSVNKTYGNFAIESKEMFMTINRRYEINKANGLIQDLTTYIDPSKYNQIFAETNIDAQNFWVQIASDITVRRKMSAKIIPNL